MPRPFLKSGNGTLLPREVFFTSSKQFRPGHPGMKPRTRSPPPPKASHPAPGRDDKGRFLSTRTTQP